LEKGTAARETLEPSLTAAGFFVCASSNKIRTSVRLRSLDGEDMSFYGRARARQICVTYVFTQDIPEKDDSKMNTCKVTTTKHTQNDQEHHEKSQTHQDEP
jgi:hypothetical protein